MARTIAQIEAGIQAAIAANPVLASLLTSESAVAEFNEWVTVFATSQQLTEVNQDACEAEVNAALAKLTPHTLQWYATKAMAFQYGDALVPDKDYYDPIAPAGDASLVVGAAAAVVVDDVVRIKVAALTAGVLGPLGGAELVSLTAYMQVVKDAGVDITVTTGAGDNLQLAMTIYYDPLVLNAMGQRIDGTENTPVMDAINAFLDTFNSSFINNQNGVLFYNALVAAIQAVSGVIIGEVTSAQANYGMTPFVDINPQYVPDAGYLVLDAVFFAANITYVAYGV
jgi:hypothetical protein